MTKYLVCLCVHVEVRNTNADADIYINHITQKHKNSVKNTQNRPHKHFDITSVKTHAQNQVSTTKTLTQIHNKIVSAQLNRKPYVTPPSDKVGRELNPKHLLSTH